MPQRESPYREQRRRQQQPGQVRQGATERVDEFAGGKRYDLAVPGRRAANATFHTSHATDRLDGITWALDLSPLLQEPEPDIAAFTCAAVDRLRDDVYDRIARMR